MQELELNFSTSSRGKHIILCICFADFCRLVNTFTKAIRLGQAAHEQA